MSFNSMQLTCVCYSEEKWHSYCTLGHPSPTQNTSFPPHQGYSCLKRCWDRFSHKKLSQTPLSSDVWCLTLLWSTALWFTSGKKKNINEHISYFVAADIVTHSLIWLKLVASFTFVLWYIRTVSGAILLFKGTRKAKIETSVPITETWSCVLVLHVLMASVPQQGQQVSSDGVCFLFPCLSWVADCYCYDVGIIHFHRHTGAGNAV